MGKRIRLGLVYLWDESWLGGVYYIQNLLKALNTLNEERKPIVHVYCMSDKAFDDLHSNTNYPYMEKTLVKRSFWKQVLRKICRYFVHEKADYISDIPINVKDDVIYPWFEGKSINKMLYWIPDFQEKHYPNMFNTGEIKKRERKVLSCCKRGIPIVFSSVAAQTDFHIYYPQYYNHNTYIVHFAVLLPNYSNIDFTKIKQKYKISKRYLICPNQFWKHKNHLFLFKAFKKAVDCGLDLQLICTGKMTDYRNPEYIDDVRNFIYSYHLETKILILGMIDKLELYCLMENSYAVVQPSLFEGWNTTVEDCKAMSKFVFLSNISVHQEQMDKNVCFFDPINEDDLADKLLSVEPNVVPYEYEKCIKQYGVDFYNIIKARMLNS